MAYGFVYVLANWVMPGTYKIGMTEGSPTKRAAELSSSTSAPAAFQVVCYAEVDDCQNAERAIHNQLKQYRVSSNREFFRCPVRWIADLILDSEMLLHFTDCELDYVSDAEGNMYEGFFTPPEEECQDDAPQSEQQDASVVVASAGIE